MFVTAVAAVAHDALGVAVALAGLRVTVGAVVVAVTRWQRDDPARASGERHK